MDDLTGLVTLPQGREETYKHLLCELPLIARACKKKKRNVRTRHSGRTLSATVCELPKVGLCLGGGYSEDCQTKASSSLSSSPSWFYQFEVKKGRIEKRDGRMRLQLQQQENFSLLHIECKKRRERVCRREVVRHPFCRRRSVVHLSCRSLIV